MIDDRERRLISVYQSELIQLNELKGLRVINNNKVMSHANIIQLLIDYATGDMEKFITWVNSLTK